MMEKEYAALGLRYEFFDDLMNDLMDATEGNHFTAPGYEGVAAYQDPSGPRLCAFKSADGWQVNPGFRGDFSARASAFRINEFLLHIDLHRLHDDEIFASFAAASDEAFAVLGGSPVTKDRLRVDDAQISAWATDFQLYDSLADWQDSDDSFVSGTAGHERRVPALLYSPSTEQFHQNLSPRGVHPYAHLSGELASADKRTNALTGQDFYVCGINTPAGGLSLLLPANASSKNGANPTAGMVFEGTVLVSASVGFWDRYDLPTSQPG